MSELVSVEGGGIDVEWYFPASYNRKIKDRLHDVLTEPALVQMADTYQRASNMLKRNLTHRCAGEFSAVRTEVYQNGEQVCMLCYLVVERGRFIPHQIQIYAGPIEYVTSRGEDIKQQLERIWQKPGADAVMIEEHPPN